MTADVAQLGLLLFISAIVAMVTRRLRLPYTVGLVLAGIALYLGVLTPFGQALRLISISA